MEALRRIWFRILGRRFWYVPYWQGRRPEYLDFDAMVKSVGPGWKEHMRKLTTKLFKLGWDGGLLQVKEKFGTLRFYWQNNIKDPILHEIADDVVWHAESLTEQICEECGKNGKIRGEGWVVVRCNDCWAKLQAERAAREAKYNKPLAE